MFFLTLLLPLLPGTHALPTAPDFSVDAAHGAYPDYPSVALNVTEYCVQGKVTAGAQFEADSGRYTSIWDFDAIADLDREASGGLKVERISGERLLMGFDYGRHVVQYQYGQCQFTSETRWEQGSCGWCVDMEGWATPWSKRVPDCGLRLSLLQNVG